MKQWTEILEKLRKESPLIHCITHPIAINDCANMVLAFGARPIMAEHPGEAAGITRQAKALGVSLGNVTESRLMAIRISGRTAYENHIPCIMDLAGVASSPLRQDFARDFIRECHPAVLKGNASEIRALAQEIQLNCGVDVQKEDAISKDTIGRAAENARKLARRARCVVLVSGKIDLVTDGGQTWRIDNGNEQMSRITGTGCMLNVIAAACLSAGAPLDACIAAAAGFGICAEATDKGAGPGTFRMQLLDAAYFLDAVQFAERARIQQCAEEFL